MKADRWTIAEPGSFRNPARYPDLLVAFDVDPQAYQANNGYIVSEQGKPPDFVLEVAAEIDVGEKRRDYAALGIGEYWRFNQTGECHGERLAGERLVEGEYVAMDIEELPNVSLQGYSAALNLNIRWERGELVFYDPETDRPIATLEYERARAKAAEERADTEQAARLAAEEHISQLEEQLRRTVE